MAERFKAADLKSAEVQASVGSNPTCPANNSLRLTARWAAPIRKQPDGTQTDSNCDTTESDAEYPITIGSHGVGQTDFVSRNTAPRMETWQSG